MKLTTQKAFLYEYLSQKYPIYDSEELNLLYELLSDEFSQEP